MRKRRVGRAGRRINAGDDPSRSKQVRIEVVAPREITESILDYVEREIAPQHPVTACLEIVDALRRDKF